MIQRPLKLFLLAIALTAAGCGSGTDSRYRDTELLERPPTLPISKQPDAVTGAVECCDDAVVPKKKTKPGLGDDVSLVPTKPMQLKIKQPVDTAWNTLGAALKQSGIKITDQERDKGFYFVAYQPASLLGGWLEHLNKEVIYLLTVTADGPGTNITAALANVTEQNSELTHFDSDDEEARSDAEDLLQRLYETLRDDLKEE